MDGQGYRNRSPCTHSCTIRRLRFDIAVEPQDWVELLQGCNLVEILHDSYTWQIAQVVIMQLYLQVTCHIDRPWWRGRRHHSTSTRYITICILCPGGGNVVHGRWWQGRRHHFTSTKNFIIIRTLPWWRGAYIGAAHGVHGYRWGVRWQMRSMCN